ncbi:MAG TPA: TIGR03435 family protein [Acidobacteriaceae bacterium]|nr:TIGR03435 family protein [Acidobacteriaceae bacterium]
MLLRPPVFLCCAAFAQPIFSQPGTVSALKPVPKAGVAVIKPSDPNTTNRFYTVRGSHFVAQNQTLANLLEIAYGLQHTQVLGGPSWVQTERFDLEAVPDREGKYSYDDWNLMLQQILADRFRVRSHHETRELPAFTLTLAKGGVRLAPTAASPEAKPSIDVKGREVITVIATDSGTADFVKILREAIVGRPVLDQTGLAGHYDFTLKFAPDRTAMSATPESAPPDLPPDLFTAIQQQLGLKLAPTKAPADVLVIDDVQHPSQN